MSEQAVIVMFDYGSTDLAPLFELEDQLKDIIESMRVGEFDGNEVAVDGSGGRLYMYGSNADALFEAVKPSLVASSCIKNVKVKLRYGPPEDGVREIVVRLED